MDRNLIEFNLILFPAYALSYEGRKLLLGQKEVR